EDGIRDRNVTGVQTCALPIWPCWIISSRADFAAPGAAVADTRGCRRTAVRCAPRSTSCSAIGRWHMAMRWRAALPRLTGWTGATRASCARSLRRCSTTPNDGSVRMDITAEFDASALSPVAAHIVELIGLDAAIVLFERYGGVRVYIPETVTAEHALTHLLGLPAARGLAAYYGREYVDIPKGLAALLAARNARIIAEHQGGRTVRDLAL